MPHTISILHLGLLVIRSPILITDLIRFVHHGKLAYSNIDKILPADMVFRYKDDSQIFNVKVKEFKCGRIMSILQCYML